MVVTQQEKNVFVIKPLPYTKEGIASVLRMFGNCIPLGCAYELPIENTYWINKLKEAGIELDDVDGLFKSFDNSEDDLDTSSDTDDKKDKRYDA